LALLLTLALLTACGGKAPPPKPEVLSQADYYLSRGSQAYANGDWVTATEMFQKGLAVYRSIDLPEGMAMANLNLAQTSIMVGNLTAAERHLDLAQVTVAREKGLEEVGQRIVLGRAAVAARQGDAEQAQTLLATLLPNFKEDGRPEGGLKPIQLSALFDRTSLAVDGDDIDQAQLWMTRLNKAVDGDKPDDPRLLGRFDLLHGRLHLKQGEAETALADFALALEHYRGGLYRPGIAATLTEWSDAEVVLDRWQQARETLIRALRVRLWLLDRAGTIAVLERIAKIDTHLGHPEHVQEIQNWIEAIRNGDPAQWGPLRPEVIPP